MAACGVSCDRNLGAGCDTVTTCPILIFYIFHFTVMVRTYKRKTDRGNSSLEDYEKAAFTGNDIWNIDETGTGSVQKPCKVIAQKAENRVRGMTSAERGTNVTMVYGVNAIGNSIHPMFLFPRKFSKVILFAMDQVAV